jgi:hypothetical protein
VHTFTRFGDPFTIARTRCTFGFQRRFVRRCEWLSFMPKIGFLPHTSQTDDIGTHLGAKSSNENAGTARKEPGEASTRPRRIVGREVAP